MKSFLISILLFAFAFSEELNHLTNLNIDISNFEIASKTDQIILVIPPNYTAPSATLYFYIKEENKWNKRVETQAYIGKNGLGKEKEGDGKTPVGIYKFNRYFGIEENPGTNLSYVQVNESYYWDGDSNSKNYNTLVNNETYSDFNMSISEHIIDYNPGYEYAINIDYNKEQTPYKGSAIFLHCFTTKNSTGGCVAIQKDILKSIYKEINKDCYIIIDTEENMDEYYTFSKFSNFSNFISVGFMMIISLVLSL